MICRNSSKESINKDALEDEEGHEKNEIWVHPILSDKCNKLQVFGLPQSLYKFMHDSQESYESNDMPKENFFMD